jgi:microcystin-dependent protein
MSKDIEIGEVGIDEEFYGKFPTDAFKFDEASDDTPTVTIDRRIKDKTGYLAPVGAIEMYGGSTAPDGWLLCNNAAISRTTYAELFGVIGTTFGVGNGSTTFNVPDFRGIFPRGAGTSAKLTDANSDAFAGTLGTYQNDKMQGHVHKQKLGSTAGSIITGQIVPNLSSFGLTQSTQVPFTDGENGTPRTGAETNPANLGITFIIKY